MQAFSSKKALSTHKPFWFVIILIMCSFCSPQSIAASGNAIALTGFYTLDITKSDRDIPIRANTRDFLENNARVTLNNSLIGVKLDYKLDDRLSFSMLGNTSISPRDELSSRITWAYLNYDLGKDYTARLGEFQTPLLQGTELRTIGLTRLWARPIIPGNGSSGFNKFLGIDLIKKKSFAKHHWIFQVATGKPDHSLNLIDGKSMALATTKYQYQDFWLRSAFINIDYELTSRSGRLIADNSNITMFSLESEYEMKYVTLHAGTSFGDSSDTPDDSMAYFSLSYPMNTLTPYIYVSKIKQDVEPLNPSSGGMRPPMPPGPPGDAVRPALRSPLSTEELSWSIGARWNWTETTIFKAQIETIDKTVFAQSGAINDITKGDILSLTMEGTF